ncbi:MAG: YihY/virulence factor BrkB family protein [Mariniblastus sp.]|nr:YihY/virulence factor BrkB family protein [Mariniblastus sp.]
MLRRIWKLITLTAAIWKQANASRMAAALTYYTMLSLAPTLMIAVAIAGYVYDSESAQAEIIKQVSAVTTPEIATTVTKLISNAITPGAGAVAGALSLAILVFAASGVFTQLCDTFNDIWNVPTEKFGVLFTIQKRLLGIGTVLIVGLLLIGALLLNSITAYLSELVAESYPEIQSWLSLADRSLTYLLMPVGFGAMFWFFPSTKVRLRDVWPAAILTALMFGGARYLVGIYMRFSTTSEVYGVSGSLVVLLIWVHMMGMVIFLGASFSHAWAQVFGSRSEFAPAGIKPSAVVSEDENENGHFPEVTAQREGGGTGENKTAEIHRSGHEKSARPCLGKKTKPVVPRRRT